jgi:6-pyruvoyl-tetrahydropterin synthase
MFLQDSKIHVARARILMAAGDEANFRYAALEIRTAIEHMFYKLLPLYREEVPYDLVKQWQPRRIIDALIECDPDIEHDYIIKVAIETSNEKTGAAIEIGRHKAVTRKLLRQYYHKLGSYLHAPMQNNCTNLQKMRRFLDAAATRVEEHCKQTTGISNVAMFHTVNCVCGRKLRRNDRAVKIKPFIRCPNEKCGAEYKLVKHDDNGSEWKLQETEFVCPECKTSNFFGSHLIDSGASFACVECGQKYKILTGLIAVRVKDISATEESTS